MACYGDAPIAMASRVARAETHAARADGVMVQGTKRSAGEGVMTEHANVALTRRGYDAFAKGEPDRLAAAPWTARTDARWWRLSGRRPRGVLRRRRASRARCSSASWSAFQPSRSMSPASEHIPPPRSGQAAHVALGPRSAAPLQLFSARAGSAAGQTCLSALPRGWRRPAHRPRSIGTTPRLAALTRAA